MDYTAHIFPGDKIQLVYPSGETALSIRLVLADEQEMLKRLQEANAMQSAMIVQLRTELEQLKNENSQNG